MRWISSTCHLPRIKYFLGRYRLRPGWVDKRFLNLVLLKNISIVGLFWGEYLKKDVDRPPEVWKDILE